MSTFSEIKAEVEVYFFGCWGQPGHYFYTPDGTRVGTPAMASFTFAEGAVDGKLAPLIEGREIEGAASLHMKTRPDGQRWTALGFWDRTGDSRPQSNSNFFAVSPEGRGFFTFTQMTDLAQLHFPAIIERLVRAGVCITLHTADYERDMGYKVLQ